MRNGHCHRGVPPITLGNIFPCLEVIPAYTASSMMKKIKKVFFIPTQSSTDSSTDLIYLPVVH
jgi:hypothetical protein